ncbi:MAG: GNAT family N-acetyltransferase [Lachnospiraceae bacterium]|nr:GNAT family N-acetyltransferase [Lachnospiraceae bacterium]
MQYTIREIEKKDNQKIEAVIRSCLIEFGANHDGTAWADPNLGRFSEIYNTEGNQYWVVENESGQIIGGAGIGQLPGVEDVCELQKMYCMPEVRGTGVSHTLMDTVLEYAKKYYAKCYLETLENMVAAQRFYEKYGFTRSNDAIAQTEHFACDIHYIKDLE